MSSTVPFPATVAEGAETAPRSSLRTLALAALGVVYGDIGTSPLYAIRECFAGEYAVAVTEPNVLGVLSLVFWSLVLVISVKYLSFVLRADNAGEGGILALLSLVAPAGSRPEGIRVALVGLGLFGAALLYGDGVLTPAISVLSAVEGLEVATTVFSPWVVPLTVAILVGLFLAQSQGTSRVGAVFGPLTLLWFLTIAALGIHGIVAAPRVLAAVDPAHAVRFLAQGGLLGFGIVGIVFLVVTGGEALYADMGHFGARAIRLAWFAVSLPALLLNYFGQGALLLSRPEAAINPFYHLAPSWGLYPLVVIATVATIIASQAIITGSFSLTRQAVQLGYLPRLHVQHTSEGEIGQIYVPAINWTLMVLTLATVLGFRSSSALAGAYGIAVTTTMVITTVLFAVVARGRFGWPRAVVYALVAFFLVFDLAYFGANIVKLAHGGWLPLSIALAGFLAMTTWRRGRTVIRRRTDRLELSVEQFLASLSGSSPVRVPGTAVFLTEDPGAVPSTLLHNLKHNKVLHENVILLTVETVGVPRVARDRRAHTEALPAGFWRAVLRYGFMEQPDIPRGLAAAGRDLPDVSDMVTTYFLGRTRPVPGRHPLLPRWRERLFAAMARNAGDAGTFFGLPSNRVVEIGSRVEV